MTLKCRHMYCTWISAGSKPTELNLKYPPSYIKRKIKIIYSADGNTTDRSKLGSIIILKQKYCIVFFVSFFALSNSDNIHLKTDTFATIR